jgi:hypothetical protein
MSIREAIPSKDAFGLFSMRGEIAAIARREPNIRIDSRSDVVEPRGRAPRRTRSLLFMHQSHGAV